MDAISIDMTPGVPHTRRMRRAWDPEKRKQIGQRIQWARELVVPSRRQFAREVLVDASAIRRIEKGDKGPSIELLQRICHELRISTDYVIGGKLIGVDVELAQMLIARHPELLQVSRDTAGRDAKGGISHRPKKPKPSARGAARA